MAGVWQEKPVCLFVCLFGFNGTSAQEGYFAPFRGKIKIKLTLKH